MLAGLVAVGACTDGSSEDTVGLPPPNAQSTVASAMLTWRVVSVSFLPYPQGSIVSRFRVTPTDSGASPYIAWTAGFAAFAETLGWPLPEPLAQPRACPRGGKNYTVVVELDSGQHQVYGPCTRPVLVEQAARLLNTGFG